MMPHQSVRVSWVIGVRVRDMVVIVSFVMVNGNG